MSLVDQLTAVVAPVVATTGVELVDVEHTGATLRVLVDEPGGIGLDRLAEVTHAISRALDASDPLPGRYTLEVSSPGVERALRTPRHFQAALGETVSLRIVDGAGARRITGTLTAADLEGLEVRAEGRGPTARFRYDQVERARTVFQWGPAPKPGKGSKPGPARKRGTERPARPAPSVSHSAPDGTDLPTTTAGQP